jgi:S-ribosylhomocysteine lyase LuxS involved in autoinducer biosynthesis
MRFDGGVSVAQKKSLSAVPGVDEHKCGVALGHHRFGAEGIILCSLEAKKSRN